MAGGWEEMTTSGLKCSTILLLYNEEGNVRIQTQEVLDSYKNHGINGEILLIDDGSEDSSPMICDEMAERYKAVRAIHHNPNKGRSFAIKTGFMEAKGEISIIMDADRQYDADEIPRFIEKIEEGWDVVSGNRVTRKDDAIRRFISRTYNKWIIGRSIGMDIKDQNSGFKAFTDEAAKNMWFEPEGYLGLHRFILPLAAFSGYSITEIPIKHLDRPEGKSYIKFYSVPLITLRDYRKLRKQLKLLKKQKEQSETERRAEGNREKSRVKQMEEPSETEGRTE